MNVIYKFLAIAGAAGRVDGYNDISVLGVEGHVPPSAPDVIPSPVDCVSSVLGEVHCKIESDGRTFEVLRIGVC